MSRVNAWRSLTDKILMRVFFACLLAACLTIPALFAQATYSDPRGRFRIDRPSGWKQAALGEDGVQFTNGDAFAVLMVYPGSNWNAALDRVARDVGGQHRNLAMVNRGATAVDGRPGGFLALSGTNPEGQDSLLTMIATDDGRCAYVLMASAPRAEYRALQPALDKIAKSFRLAGARPPVRPRQ